MEKLFPASTVNVVQRMQVLTVAMMAAAVKNPRKHREAMIVMVVQLQELIHEFLTTLNR